MRGVEGLSPENGVQLYALKFAHLECLALDFALDLVAGRRVDAGTESEGLDLLRQKLHPGRTRVLTAEWSHEAEAALERREIEVASAALDQLSSLTGREAESGLLRDWAGVLTDDARARTLIESFRNA